MKITVFGASGTTGKHVVEQALGAGHQVIAFARAASKLGVENPNLTVVQGDISEGAAVERAIAGTDAVISVLGPTSNTAERTVTNGMKHILAAMKKHGVRRLVVSTGAGVRDAQDAPGLFDTAMGALVKTVSRNVYNDMLGVVECVRASDCDWTVVRVPMLTNDPPSGRIRVAYVGKGMGRKIGRADLADFMVRQVTDLTYVRQAPAISNE